MNAADARALVERDDLSAADLGFELGRVARDAGARADALRTVLRDLPAFARWAARRREGRLRRQHDRCWRDSYVLLEAVVTRYVDLGLIDRGQHRPDLAADLLDRAILADADGRRTS